MSVSLAEGTVFAGRYQLVRCIASGGMGAVYEAIHLETQRRRALKVMHPHLFASGEMRDRFKLEARIAAQVESEYIVDVSDAGVDEATQMPFLVMELLRGEELGDRLKRVGRLPPHEVVTYLQQAAWALDKTHAASIVHRDLKPANLFLTQREDGSPRIKILDFGVAKLIAEGATQAGATRSLGTPLYMAPEQFRVGIGLTAAADIYALGLMAYTLLVGDAYWQHEARGSGNVIAFALAAQQGPMEPASRRAAAHGVMLPPTFDLWFQRVAAANPAARYPTASEAVRALAEALGIPSGAAMMPPGHTSSGLSGSFGPVGARTNASWPYVPGGSGPQPAVMDRAASTTGSTTTPGTGRRNIILAIAAVLALPVVAAGVILALRASSSAPAAPAPAASAPVIATSVAPATPPTTAQPTSPTPTVEPAGAAPTASASTAPVQPAPTEAASVEPAPTAPTRPTAPRVPTARPSAGPKPPKPSPGTPSAPLLGRD